MSVPRLASEHLVVQAPMSFSGSAARCRRIVWKHPDNLMVKIAVWGFLFPVWWLLVLVWYLTFGLLLVPYRLIRRGQRKRKVEEYRHREQIAHMARVANPANDESAPPS